MEWGKDLGGEESAALSPPDPESFCFQMHIFIGAVGLEGYDCFDVTACSPP
jgi:hypothetical protein